MPENQEMSIAEEESLRAEIKGIIHSFEGKDATAVEVVSFEELDREDLEAWKMFKAILAAVNNLDLKNNKDILKDELNKFLGLAEELKSKGYNSLKTGQEQSKNSKANFGAWLNNKGPLPLVKMAVETAAKGDVVGAAKHLQDMLKNKYEFYVKDGWKKK